MGCGTSKATTDTGDPAPVQDQRVEIDGSKTTISTEAASGAENSEENPTKKMISMKKAVSFAKSEISEIAFYRGSTDNGTHGGIIQHVLTADGCSAGPGDEQVMAAKRLQNVGVISSIKKSDRSLSFTGSGRPKVKFADDTDSTVAEAHVPPGIPDSELQDNVKSLNSSNLTEVQTAVQFLRRVVSVPSDPPIKALRAAGVVPRLIELLAADENAVLQYECCWVLTNIASGEHDDCQDIVDYNAVPALVRLLSSPSNDVVNQAVWALGNIAGDNPGFQLLVIENGMLPPLLSLLSREDLPLQMVRDASWALSNLCKPKPPSKALYDALPVMKSLLQRSEDREVMNDVCWALTYITTDEEALPMFHEQDMLDRLVELVKCYSDQSAAFYQAAFPAVRVLGNMAAGTEPHTQAVVDSKALPVLVEALSTCSRVNRLKEVVWTISNIAAGSPTQKLALVASGAFQVVCRLCGVENDALRKECAYVLGNPFTGIVDEVLLRQLLNVGCIQGMCSLVNPYGDPKLLLIVLQGLWDAFMACRTLGIPPEQLSSETVLPPPSLEGQLLMTDTVLEMRGSDLAERLEPLSKHPDTTIWELSDQLLQLMEPEAAAR